MSLFDVHFRRLLPAGSIGLVVKSEAEDPALSSDLAVLNALLSGTHASFVEALWAIG